MPSDRQRHAAEQFNRFAERVGAPSRCDPAVSFKTPELVQVEALWQDKSVGGAMPERGDMNARTLKAYLPHILIADVIETDGSRRYRFRLMGTAISRVFGDHTGRFLDEAIVSPYRERWTAAVDTALEAGGPVRLSGRIEYKLRDHLAMEIFLAPIGQRPESAEAVLVAAYAQFSARHVFEPMVRNAISVPAAPAGAVGRTVSEA